MRDSGEIVVCAMFKTFLSFKRFLIIQFIFRFIVDKVDTDLTSFNLAKCRLASLY